MASRQVLSTLASALRGTDDKAKDLICGAVRKLRESGVQNLNAASQAEDSHGEVTQLYNRTINRLTGRLLADDSGGGGSFAVHPCGSLPRVCGASGFLFPHLDRHVPVYLLAVEGMKQWFFRRFAAE